MPTIHVSKYVMDMIENRSKDGESPTDTVRRVFDRDEEFVEEKIEEVLRNEMR